MKQRDIVCRYPKVGARSHRKMVCGAVVPALLPEPAAGCREYYTRIGTKKERAVPCAITKNGALEVILHEIVLHRPGKFRPCIRILSIRYIIIAFKIKSAGCFFGG